MVTQSKDTDLKSEKVLIELMRKASAAEKFARLSSLSQLVRNLSKVAIVRSNPDLSPAQIDILFLEYHYGKELAEKVKNYLEKELIFSQLKNNYMHYFNLIIIDRNNENLG